ncbi:hypothetical protein ACE103_08520 [Bradyrhizobium sp. ma5]|uniref:hypothetical protein n=1 Tax=Bradyrhizobium sp. ma5 TaxID=3344828 RepID=UPI0035D496E4
MQLFSKGFSLRNREVLDLRKFPVVLSVVIHAHERQIARIVVARVAIQMSDLPSFQTIVALQSEANAASTTRV